MQLRRLLFRKETKRSFHKDYTFQRLLGNGTSSSVHVVKHRVSGGEFAVKVIHLDRLPKSSHALLKQEVDILKTLDHPNIVKVYDVYLDKSSKCMYLVMQLLRGGDLFARLERANFHLTEALAATFVHQMLRAVFYIHSHKIVHRDLKIDNFVFEGESGEELKLIDFGFSQCVSSAKSEMSRMVGTLDYIAPEVLSGNYTMACDMWSLGVATYVLLCGKAPFGCAKDTEQTIMRRIRSGEFSISGAPWESVSRPAIDFIRRLLVVDPTKRMTAAQAMNHTWIRLAGEAREHGNTPLANGKIACRLMQYRSYSLFRKVALQAIVYMLDDGRPRGGDRSPMTPKTPASRAVFTRIDDVKRAFYEIDTDGDGFISFAEFKAWFRSLGEAQQHSLGEGRFVSKQHPERRRRDTQTLFQLFNSLDFDHSGGISYSEFLAAAIDRKYYDHKEVLYEVFDRLDVDRNGFIECDDLLKLLGEDEFSIEDIRALFHSESNEDDAVDRSLMMAASAPRRRQATLRVDREQFIRVVLGEGDSRADAAATEAPAETRRRKLRNSLGHKSDIPLIRKLHDERSLRVVLRNATGISSAASPSGHVPPSPSPSPMEIASPIVRPRALSRHLRDADKRLPAPVLVSIRPSFDRRSMDVTVRWKRPTSHDGDDVSVYLYELWWQTKPAIEGAANVKPSPFQKLKVDANLTQYTFFGIADASILRVGVRVHWSNGDYSLSRILASNIGIAFIDA